jgi:hypothetical protein
VSIPASESEPLVAGVALDILLGLPLREGFRRDDLLGLDLHHAERGPVAIGITPVLGSQAGVEDFDHVVLTIIGIVFVFLVIVVIVPATPPPKPADLFRRA